MMFQPNSISDEVWADILSAQRYNDNRRAMSGYKELAEKDGPDQAHYQSMYQYLKRWVDDADTSFSGAKYAWIRTQDRGAE